MKTISFIILIIFIFISLTEIYSQESKKDLSQQAANPIANLMSFPFQNNTDFNWGPYDRTKNVLNIQPVIPLFEGKLITRTIFPFAWIPDISNESGMYGTGISDINFTAFWVPTDDVVMWGIGPVLGFPSGDSQTGSGKWTIGPSIVALYQPGNWTLGILANNVWSYAGDENRDEISKGLIQYFLDRIC